MILVDVRNKVGYVELYVGEILKLPVNDMPIFFYPEEGGSSFLQNSVIHLTD
jgi:hypothetical protein